MEINGVCQGRQTMVSDSYQTNLNNVKNTVNETKVSGEQKNSLNKQKLSEKNVKDITEGLNKLIEQTKTHVKYEKHDKFNEFIIKIIDDETGDVIKEIPPKKILDMIAKMCENLGIFVDKKV